MDASAILPFWKNGSFVVFYEVLRLCGCSITNDVSVLGGPAKEGPHVRGGSELGSYEFK